MLAFSQFILHIYTAINSTIKTISNMAYTLVNQSINRSIIATAKFIEKIMPE